MFEKQQGEKLTDRLNSIILCRVGKVSLIYISANYFIRTLTNPFSQLKDTTLKITCKYKWGYFPLDPISVIPLIDTCGTVWCFTGKLRTTDTTDKFEYKL